MTEAQVRAIVADMLGIDPDGESVGKVFLKGNVSKKSVADVVTEASMHSKYVLVDMSDVRQIAGRKPWWRS